MHAKAETFNREDRTDMTYDEFKSALNDIFNHFQAKKPDNATLNIWFEQVEKLPAGEPLSFIGDRIRDLDSLPKNIPKAFKAGWNEWLNANQNRIAKQRLDAKTKCGHCGGSGLIHFSGDDHGIKYQHVCRCQQCRNWEDQVSGDLPAYTKEHLQQRGYQVIEAPRSGFTIKTNLKVLACGIV